MRLNVRLQRFVDKIGIDRLWFPFSAWARWQWERNGRPPPAPAWVKREIIRDCAGRHSLRVLVETGTFLGDTVRAMLPHFDRIYSIELSDALYERASARFRDEPRVALLHGDSAIQISTVLRRLRGPALFWLDGHYSAGFTAKGPKDTPIVEELDAVLASDAPHVILIDDARLFDGSRDYPTLRDVQTRVERAKRRYSMRVADDIISILPIDA